MFQRRPAKKKAARKSNQISRRLAAIANPPLFAHLAIEPLEERRMLANNVTASVTANVLNISFTASDTANISTSAGNVVVTDVGTSGTVLSTAETGVNSIVVTNGTGTDLLTITSALTWSNLASVTEGPGLSSVTLSANVTTTGAQTYNDPVTLGAAVTLTSSSSGNIALDSTVNGAQTLAVSTAGTSTFGGIVGGTTALTSVTDTTGTVDINTTAVTTTGLQSYAAVALGAGTTLTSSGSGNITFNGTVNGADTLAVSTSGTSTFGGIVGGTTALTSVTDTSGTVDINTTAITTTGLQSYAAVSLGAGATLTSSGSGNITFNSTVNGAQTLAVSTGGTSTFSGVVGGTTALTSLTDTSGTVDINTTAITTTGLQSYAAVVLGSSTTLTSTTSGNITFNSTVNGAFSLVVSTAGTIAFDGAVGATTALTSLTAGSGTTDISGNVTTTNGAGAGNQTYNGAVVLEGSSAIQFKANGSTATTVTFGSSLTAATSATATVTGVGSAAAVSMSINAETTTVTSTPTTIQVTGEPVVTFSNLAGITLTNTGTASLTVDGASGGSNTLTVSRVSASNDTYAFASGPTVTFPFGNAIGFNTTGDGNNNTLDIVRSATFGDPVSTANGASFTGGSGTGNTLNISGGTVTNLVYNATGAGAGNVSLDSAKTTFTGLQPVTVTSTPTNVTINVTDTVSHKITLGQVSPTPVTGESEVSIDGGFESMTFANPSSSLSLTGTGHADTITLNTLGSGFSAPTINLTDGSGAEFDIEATPASSTTTISPNVATLTSPQTVYVGTTSGTFNNGTGTLANILGNIAVNTTSIPTTGGSEQIYVGDSGDTTARTFTVTSSSINSSGFTGTAPMLSYTGNQINVIQVAGGTGGNTFTVTSTFGGTIAQPATTTLFGGFGTGTNTNTFNVSVPGLAGQVNLDGEGVASTYNVNFTGGSSIPNGTPGPAGANLAIFGHTGGTSNHRDTVNLNAQSGAGGRTVGFNYLDGSTGSSIGVTGLGGTAGVVDATNVQQVDYNGATAGDNLTVTGPTTASDITVAPQSASSALVFLGATGTGAGAGWAGPPATYATTYPGIDGGSLAPDLYLKGATTGGLLVNGGATNNDQLTVYAPAEVAVHDAATTSNPFGFGTGVIVPAVATSANTIHVSDAVGLSPSPAPAVQISNSVLGTLLPVGIGSDAPFVQTTTPTVTPGMIVNTGGTNDNVFVTPSANFKIQVNEINATPNNDTITIVTPAALDIWSNASTPPIVTAGGPGTYGVGYTNFSNVDLAPGNGQVNIFGNDNNAATPQFDYDQVVGTGFEAFTLTIGASTANLAAARSNLAAPINLTGVTTLNVFGGPNLPGNPAVPNPPVPTSNYPDTDTNELNITPWANNTPEGWGLQTYFNQGNSSADDLLVYNGTAGVSENIAIQPSGQGQGQVYATNPAAGNSSIAVVNYALNTDIEVNGTNSGTGEVDNLTLYGTKPANGNTSGSDTFTADFGGAGTPADPYVAVTDSANSNTLYNLLNTTNINTFTMNGQGGGDTFNIDSFFTAGGPKIYVNGGATGAGAATVNLGTSVGAPADSAVYGDLTYTPGSNTGSGTISQFTTTFLTNTLTFSNTQTVNLDGDGTANESELFINGIGNNDTFLAEPNFTDEDPAGSGTVQVDSYTPINFLNYGAGAAVLSLDAVGNSAKFNITPMAGIASITADGDGLQPQSNSVTVNGQQNFNAVTVSPTGPTTATVAITGLATVFATAAGSLLYNGQDFGDTLAVVPPAGTNTATYTPGNAPDAGSFQVDNLIPFSYVNLGLLGSGSTVTYGLAANTDTLTVQGTSSNDTFSVAALTGTITLNSQLPLVTTGVTTLDLNGNGGVDTFDIGATIPYTGGINVDAAGAAGDDPLNVTGPATNVAIGVTLNSQTQVQTITGLGGPINVTGVGTVNIAGGGGSDDTLAVTSMQSATLTYTPTGANAGTFSETAIFPVFNFSAITGTFTAAGVAGNTNSVTVNATSNNDTVVINENTAVTPNISPRSVNVFNPALTPPLMKPVLLDPTADTIQSVTVDGGLGSDSFLVVPNVDVAGNGVVSTTPFKAPSNLLVNIVGGPTGGNADSLAVATYTAAAGGLIGSAGTLAASDFAVVDRTSTTSGIVRLFTNTPSLTQFPDIDYSNIGIVQPDVVTTGPNGLGSNSLVLGPDPDQPNNSFNTATYLGSGSTITASNLTIFPMAVNNQFINADQSYFRVVAPETGTLEFDLNFTEYTGLLPNNGELQIMVYDQNGNPIASNFGAGNTGGHVNLLNSDGQRVRIPAVAGESYYVRVFGLSNAGTLDTYSATSLSINGYSLSVTNTPTPTPTDLSLNQSIAQGSATAGSTTSVTGASLTNTATTTFVPLSNTAGAYVGQYLTFADSATDGAVLGQTALITAYSGATHIFTLQAAGTTPGIGLSVAPPVGAKFQIESSDTGRSQLDSVTRESQPTIYINLADTNLLDDLTGGGTNSNSPPIGTIPITYDPSTTPLTAPYAPAIPTAPEGFRIAIFDEADPGSTSGNNPVLIGYAQAVAGLQGIYSFTPAAPLTEGVNYLTAEVQMISQTKTGTPTVANVGFGSSSAAFELDVDTQAPLVYFGSVSNGFDGLIAQDQQGGVTMTNDPTPTFYGVAQADAIINLYAVTTVASNLGPAGTPVLLGQGQATPTDGTNQDQTGAWQVTSLVSLNDPTYFALNGDRTIEVTATDPAGNISTVQAPYTVMTLLLQTTGPFISNVEPGFNGTVNNYNLFAPKPQQSGPTPLTNQLNITVTATLPADTVAEGTIAASPAPTTTAITVGTPSTPFSPVNGFYDNQYFTLINDPADPENNVTARITGYTASPTIKFTFATPSGGLGFTTAPLAGDNFIVQPVLPSSVAPAYYQTGQGTVTGTATTTVVSGVTAPGPAAALSSTNGFYDGQYLVVNGQMEPITGYTYSAGVGTFTLGTALSAAPAAGTAFTIEAQAPPGYLALLVTTAEDAANYSLVGKTLGTIPIESAIVTNFGVNSSGEPTATVTLTFASPLRNDIYTLTVSDALTDILGNQLLGDVTQIYNPGNLPYPSGMTPSGLAPPSNFVASFLVDTDASAGTYADASTSLDLAGYGPTTFTLAVPGDPLDSMGIHDTVFSGNFPTPGGTANGFDKLAAYGYDSNLGSFRWLINTDGTNTITVTAPNTQNASSVFSVQPADAQINGLPVAGNFSGVASEGDQLGLFTGTQFLLDLQPVGTAAGNVVDPTDYPSAVEVVNLPAQMRGAPVVGDFLGNGIPDLATYLNGTFYILIGAHSAGPNSPIVYNTPPVEVQFAFPGVAAQPVAADVYGVGIDDLGLWVPSASGNESTGGQFYFLSPVNPATYIPQQYPGGAPITVSQLVSADNQSFTPQPLGNDYYVQYGTNPALPLAGDWDPPYSSSGSTATVTPTVTSLGIVQGPVVSPQAVGGSTWVSATPARNGNLEVSVGAANGGKVEASLYDSNYNLLASGTVDEQGNLTFTTAAVAGQTYYIQLTGLVAGTSGSVTVTNQVPLTQRLDVLQQGTVTPADALALINYLNEYGSTTLNLSSSSSASNPLIYYDVNMQGSINPSDALAIINYLNSNPASVIPQAAPAVTPQVAAAADSPATVTPQAVSSSLPASSGSSSSGNAGLAAAVADVSGTSTSSTSTVNAAVTAVFQQSSAPVSGSSTPPATTTSSSTSSSSTTTSASSSSDSTASIDAALGDSTDWLE